MLQQVELFKPNVLIDIQVSEEFFKRVQNLAVYFTTLKTPEQLQEIVQNLAVLSETDDFAQNFETVLVLVKTIEEQARLQGKTEMVTIPDAPPAIP
jgi:gamma-glutamyl phosphate reductase